MPNRETLRIAEKAAGDGEFLHVARDVAKNSNCVRRHVGCVLVRNSSVITSGWNGVHILPELNCVEAGCPR